MKLRMDHRAREGNQAPFAAIHSSHHDAAAASPLDRRRHPLSSRGERALSKLPAGELDDASLGQTRAVDLPHSAAAHEEDVIAARMNCGRVWVDRRPIGELADLA